MSAKHLQRIRLCELERAMPVLAGAGAVLEIGAGAGWQSKALADRGFSVEAIDIANDRYRDAHVWPVRKYDGRHIPFPAGTFDVVFSSNVLEHIEHIAEFQPEIRRVLRPTGLAVHILPTGSWRFWTNLTHYLFVTKVLMARVLGIRPVGQESSKQGTGSMPKRSKVELLRKVLIPPRHGEKGNCLTEIYLFSRYRWERFFERTGWSVELCYPVKLFYTGYSILDASLSIKLRRPMSHVLGSSCLVYVLRPR